MKSEKIPSTAMFHARLFGHGSVKDFANSLPKNARIADIGAGISNFGYEVCKIRPDIKWDNIDPCYSSAKIQKGLPDISNLTYLSLDITDPQVTKKIAKRYDLVYSYWLLPHLSANDEMLARKAVDNITTLAKTKGTIAVGPKKKVGLGFFSWLRYKGLVIGRAAKSNEQLANQIFDQTKLWWLPRIIQNCSNKYGIHLGMYFVGGKIK